VFAVRLPLFPPDLLPILDESRALRAGDDFFVENDERRWHCQDCKAARVSLPLREVAIVPVLHQA
jgi:hypothetical protein